VSTAITTDPTRTGGLRARFRRRIPQAWRTPLGITGAAVATVWILVAVLGPVLWPYGPLAQDFARLEAPSGAHWFGTDELGRDVFTRVLAGARVTVPLAMLLVGLSVVVGGILGLAAGFFAVFFYRRRTGGRLNVKAGMRMGWITGVMMFVITTVIFTLTIIPVAASGGIGAMFRSQFKNLSDPKVQEALKMLDTGPGLAAALLATLFMLFIFITLLSMAGGALGAKMTGRGETASGSSV
jgi:hypothetical protein